MISVLLGGRTPALAAADFTRLGFGIVLYANAALQGAARGMTQALERLRQTGRLDEDLELVATFAERQSLASKDEFDALGVRYRIDS